MKCNEIANRRNNGSMKWDKAYIKKRFNIDSDDVLPLFIADTDYEMNPKLKALIMEYMNDFDFGYFNVEDSFYEAVITWYKNVHNLKLKRESIMTSVGTIASISFVYDFLRNDKKVLMLTPVYGGFGKCLDVKDCIYSDLVFTDKYHIDFDKLENDMKNNDISIFVFCNPHNPSGRIWNESELEKIVYLCKKYDILLVSDEIHSDLSLSDNKCISLINYSNIYSKIIISTSINKTFNISGLSTSIIICNDDKLRNLFKAYMDKLHLSSNRFGLKVSEILYSNGQMWVDEFISRIKYNVDILLECLSDTNIVVVKPEASFLVWIYLPNIKNSDEFVLDLAKDTHVLLETGSRFLANYDKWLRINVATSSDIVLKAMQLLKEFYNKY